MRIDNIKLKSFRNYDDESISFSDGINVICGRNAQGKTNLLEAVYMLCVGRSFRTRFDREIIQFDRDFARVEADINAGSRAQHIEISMQQGQRKQIQLNGVKKSANDLGGSFNAVLFCPDDLNLIKEGAFARRRLMDMAISQLRPGYAKLISDYNKLYDNKTRILRDYSEDSSMIVALDDFSESMARVGAQIVRYRASFAARLQEHAAKIHREFSGSDEELKISYFTVTTVTNPTARADAIFEEIMRHQRSHRQAELATGQCLTGIHKDDLDIDINGQAARTYASQGQARTAALSLKLSEREIYLTETGEYPVLLLDDVLSELDTQRQEFVLNRIGGGQTLITCCEDEQIATKTGGRVLFVENGRIREENI